MQPTMVAAVASGGRQERPRQSRIAQRVSIFLKPGSLGEAGRAAKVGSLCHAALGLRLVPWAVRWRARAVCVWRDTVHCAGVQPFCRLRPQRWTYIADGVPLSHQAHMKGPIGWSELALAVQALLREGRPMPPWQSGTCICSGAEPSAANMRSRAVRGAFVQSQ
jgi:hypothetical protein